MSNDVGQHVKRLRTFIREGIWDADLGRLPMLPSILIRTLRVILLMLRGIKDDELSIRASALTFISLVSIVPMLSIAFSISRGLDFGSDIVNKISKFAETQPETVQEVIGQIISLVENTNFQSLGWFGVAFLIITATLVLNGLEKTLNRIWGISRSRNMIRRIANYISLLVVIPIFIGVAGTVQGIIFSGQPGAAGILQGVLLKAMPFLSVCLGLALLYATLPNLKVGILPAIISGLAGALLWTIWQKAFISLQLSVVKYNAIYGTFAAIPIFLVWLHTSWIIILLGAEVAFAVQYHNTLHLERGALGASVRVRQLLALSVMRQCAHAFLKDGELFDKREYSDNFQVPIKLVNEITELLLGGNLILPVSERENCYVLARDPANINVKEVMDMVENAGKGVDDFGLEKLENRIHDELELADRGAADALQSRSMASLV